MSNTCSLCNRSYVWLADLKRHLKSKHGQQKSTLKQQQQPYTYTPEQQQQQPYTYTPEQQQQQQPYTSIPEQQQQQQQSYMFTPDQQHGHIPQNSSSRGHIPQNSSRSHTRPPLSSSHICLSQSSSSGHIPPSSSSSTKYNGKQEPFWIIPTKDPDNLVCADGPDPNHFMPWIHHFTSVISDQPEVDNLSF